MSSSKLTSNQISLSSLVQRISQHPDVLEVTDRIKRSLFEKLEIPFDNWDTLEKKIVSLQSSIQELQILFDKLKETKDFLSLFSAFKTLSSELSILVETQIFPESASQYDLLGDTFSKFLDSDIIPFFNNVKNYDIQSNLPFPVLTYQDFSEKPVSFLGDYRFLGYLYTKLLLEVFTKNLYDFPNLQDLQENLDEKKRSMERFFGITDLDITAFSYYKTKIEKQRKEVLDQITILRKYISQDNLQETSDFIKQLEELFKHSQDIGIISQEYRSFLALKESFYKRIILSLKELQYNLESDNFDFDRWSFIQDNEIFSDFTEVDFPQVIVQILSLSQQAQFLPDEVQYRVWKAYGKEKYEEYSKFIKDEFYDYISEVFKEVEIFINCLEKEDYIVEADSIAVASFSEASDGIADIVSRINQIGYLWSGERKEFFEEKLKFITQKEQEYKEKLKKSKETFEQQFKNLDFFQNQKILEETFVRLKSLTHQISSLVSMTFKERKEKSFWNEIKDKISLITKYDSPIFSENISNLLMGVESYLYLCKLNPSLYDYGRYKIFQRKIYDSEKQYYTTDINTKKKLIKSNISGFDTLAEYLKKTLRDDRTLHWRVWEFRNYYHFRFQEDLLESNTFLNKQDFETSGKILAKIERIFEGYTSFIEDDREFLDATRMLKGKIDFFQTRQEGRRSKKKKISFKDLPNNIREILQDTFQIDYNPTELQFKNRYRTLAANFMPLANQGKKEALEKMQKINVDAEKIKAYFSRRK